jgi:hypothetical protein
MENKKSSDKLTFAISVVCLLIGMYLSAVITRNNRYWVSEPYEPTIKITIENGVQDTTYGYTLNKILEQ